MTINSLLRSFSSKEKCYYQRYYEPIQPMVPYVYAKSIFPTASYLQWLKTVQFFTYLSPFFFFSHLCNLGLPAVVLSTSFAHLSKKIKLLINNQRGAYHTFYCVKQRAIPPFRRMRTTPSNTKPINTNLNPLHQPRTDRGAFVGGLELLWFSTSMRGPNHSLGSWARRRLSCDYWY